MFEVRWKNQQKSTDRQTGRICSPIWKILETPRGNRIAAQRLVYDTSVETRGDAVGGWSRDGELRCVTSRHCALYSDGHLGPPAGAMVDETEPECRGTDGSLLVPRCYVNKK